MVSFRTGVVPPLIYGSLRQKAGEDPETGSAGWMKDLPVFKKA